MWEEGPDRGDESAAPIPAEETAGMAPGTLLVIREADGLAAMVAWARGFHRDLSHDFPLVYVPRLFLSQDVVQSLVAMIPYHKVFANCVLEEHLDHRDTEHFTVIGAEFMLYRTGAPELRDVRIVVNNHEDFDFPKYLALFRDLLT